jgi:hypothetical protein
MLLPLTLFLFSWISTSEAGSVQIGQPCSVNDNKLQIGSYQFYTQCDSQSYCSQTTGTCQKRGCRKDVFPFGYAQDDPDMPPMCPNNQFCPDEMDQCQPLLPVNSPCQLNRDGKRRPFCFMAQDALIFHSQINVQLPQTTKILLIRQHEVTTSMVPSA